MTAYERAWYVGDRTGVLERTIDALKFDRVKDAAGDLASLLNARLPILPVNTVIVPVPTISRHVRQRGYDHIVLIAKDFAKLRDLHVESKLMRADHTMQRGANKNQRLRQAENAFSCKRALDPSKVYLIIDDVVTTNATVRYAAAALRGAGAETVWVAALARQPLDKSA